MHWLRICPASSSRTFAPSASMASSIPPTSSGGSSSGVRRPPGLAVVLMGVSGSGKSTVGELLGKSVPCRFVDADDLHSQQNKEKMRSGVPLTDGDRQPWLRALRDELAESLWRRRESVVLACSALDPRYRDLLVAVETSPGEEDIDGGGPHGSSSARRFAPGRVAFVHLDGPEELFAARLAARYAEGAHFMPPCLLRSQLDALRFRDDERRRVMSVDASLSSCEIVDCIKKEMLSDAHADAYADATAP